MTFLCSRTLSERLSSTSRPSKNQPAFASSRRFALSRETNNALLYLIENRARLFLLTKKHAFFRKITTKNVSQKIAIGKEEDPFLTRRRHERATISARNLPLPTFFASHHHTRARRSFGRRRSRNTSENLLCRTRLLHDCRQWYKGAC